MADRTIIITCDGWHSVGINITQATADRATTDPRSYSSIVLALKIGEEAIRLLALPDPTSTVEIGTA